MEVLALQQRAYDPDEVLTLQTRVCYRYGSINITITSILPGLKY